MLRKAEEVHYAYFSAFSPDLTFEEWMKLPRDVRDAIVAMIPADAGTGPTDHRPADPASGSAQPTDRSSTDDPSDPPRPGR